MIFLLITAQTAHSAADLQYAPPPKWHQRPRFRWALKRLVIVVVLLLLLMWSPVLFYLFRYRLPVKRAQNVARTYAPPSTQHVVYDDDPQTYPALLSGGGGYISSCPPIPGNRYAAYDNKDFDGFVIAQGGGSGGGIGRPFTLPVAFLHERASPKGNRRIVAVQLLGVRSTSSNVFGFYPELLDGPPPKSPKARPTTSPPLNLYRGAGAPLRVYDGLIDPTDSSRFTFVVEYNGQKTDVHGQLLDDDRVRLMPTIGQVADFRYEIDWCPPGVALPSNYEPSCFVNIATTKPTQYLASPPGVRQWTDAQGMLMLENVKTGTTQRTGSG